MAHTGREGSLEVQVTELDLSLYVASNDYAKADYYTPETLDLQLQLQQANRYADFFRLFRDQSDTTAVSFWGVADDNTWLSELDSGRQDFPLLFDLAHERKPAGFAVVDF